MECEVMSKTYEQIQIDPQEARAVGDMELSGKTYGFHLTALTAAMLDPLLGGLLTRDVTLITEAECVKVTKAATAAWVAGDPIFWIQGEEHFTNVDDGAGYLVGKAAKDAAIGDVVGYMIMHDYYPVQRGLQLGTSDLRYKIAAEDPLQSLYTKSDAVASEGNVEPVIIDTVLTGIGATGGRGIFKLSTEVKLGGWCNALKAITSFGTNGAVTGLGSGFCAELHMPATPPAGGHYAALEAEIQMPTGAGVGAGTSYLYCNVQEDGKTAFQAGGFFAIIDNAGDASDGLFYDTSNGTTDAWLRIKVNGIAYYIMLSLAATEA